MKFIIDGDYNRDLITSIINKDLPVSHIIIHAPHNPIGNSSIFLPEKLPKYEEFESYTKFVQEHGLIPIVGIDSTCQGNLEAHQDQYIAIKSFYKDIIEMGYENILISSPNNIAFVKSGYPSLKIFLSYSQSVTSSNRARLMFQMGASSIILHPDILKYFHAMGNFNKIKEKYLILSHTDFILPLNLGCNWGCIYWFDHHNIQSHRTMNSPVSPNQELASDVENEFDYPLLNCWKKRLEQPNQILKAGWITPYNISNYVQMGYDTFLLFTYNFSTNKIINIIEAYVKNSFEGDFNEILNFPKPYGNYWENEKLEESMIQLENNMIKEFCYDFPYKNSYFPFEDEIDKYCNGYLEKFNVGNIEERNKILSNISQKLKQMERGAING